MMIYARYNPEYTYIFRKEHYMQNDSQEYQCEMIIAEGRDDFKDADFTKVFKLMSRKVVLDLGNGKINGAADTLWWIMDQMPMNNNYVGAKPQNIARDIGKSVVQVRRHLKHLLNLGFAAAQIISTGGPIKIDDLRSLSSEINEFNVKTFKTKIEKFWKIAESKLNQGSFNKVILLLDEKNKVDANLKKNDEEFQKKISVPFEIITFESFDEIQDKVFSFLNTKT